MYCSGGLRGVGGYRGTLSAFLPLSREPKNALQKLSLLKNTCIEHKHEALVRALCVFNEG